MLSNKKGITTWILGIIVSTLLTTAASAETLHVPADYLDLTEALMVAPVDSIIVLAEGEYELEANSPYSDAFIVPQPLNIVGAGANLTTISGRIEMNGGSLNSLTVKGGVEISWSALVQNCVIDGQWREFAISMEADAILLNNVITSWGGSGGIGNCSLWPTEARNNIFYNLTVDMDYCTGFKGFDDITFDYNNLYNVDYIRFGDIDNNFETDPAFVDPEKEDFRLQLESPCIDAGDPNLEFSLEAQPNGKRVNIGAFGNTTSSAISTSLVCGDLNADSRVNMQDITYFIGYLYKGGPAANPHDIADVNADGFVNLRDITYLISYLYKDGPAPCSL